MMAHFGKAIRALRERQKLSIREFADKADISPATVVKNEASATPTGHQATYRAIAGGFGITVNDLDRLWRATAIGQTKGGDGIPLINCAPAGDVVDYEEFGTDSGQGYSYVPRGDITDPNAFAVKVVGESMVSAMFDGEIAIFSPNRFRAETMPDGKIVFIRFSEDSRYHGCTIARVFREPDSHVLLAKDNPKFQRRRVRTDEIIRMSALVERRIKVD